MSKTYLIRDGARVIDRATGRPVMVSGSTKRVQDIQICLTSEVRPSGYGAGLDERVGQVEDVPEFIALITQDTRDAITRLQQLMTRQSAQRPPEERIDRVARVEAFLLDQTNTAYGFEVDVVGRDNVTATVTREF